MVTSILLEKKDIIDSANVPEWVAEEYEIFTQKVTTNGFPCHFGTIAERRHELRYTYSNHNDWASLPSSLEAFMELARTHPKVRHAMIGFFEPEQQEHPFSYYRQRFWDVCNFLHQHDRKPWPNDIPSDTADPLWEFCFDGEPLFLFVGFPAYKQRNSRRFGKSMMILYQPKRVFNGLEGATPGGIEARKQIRPRLQKWDGGMEMHPDFNIIDEALAFRWKQYCASDDNTPAVGECPFHITNG
jgi:FPC/CPF motif-containing protein YcgG